MPDINGACSFYEEDGKFVVTTWVRKEPEYTPENDMYKSLVRLDPAVFRALVKGAEERAAI